MRRVLNAAGADELPILRRETVIHLVARNEGCGAQWHLEFVAGAVIVADDLAASLGHGDSQQGRNTRWVQIVQGCIDVPAVEAGVLAVVLLGDAVPVEGLVVRVAELEVHQSFVAGDESVSDDLHLRLARNRLQVRMQDAALRVECRAMSVCLGLRVEAARYLVLRLCRQVLFALHDDDAVPVEGIVEKGEIGFCSSALVPGHIRACCRLKAQDLPWEVTDPRSAPAYLEILQPVHSHSNLPERFSRSRPVITAPKSLGDLWVKGRTTAVD